MHIARSGADDLSGLLRTVKKVSGARIRAERQRRKMTREDFAAMAGISKRWLGEIERGNPGARLEDHLRAAHCLELPFGYIALALLLFANGMAMPQHLLQADTVPIERACADLAASSVIRELTDELTPRWREAQARG
jgi:transcriptional regulator with XRE-family HTH domain